MPRSALQALLLASIVLLAGCSLPGTQNPSTPDDEPATTPSPGTTPTPTPGSTYPAGVTADGVRSAWDLASAHAALLAETSYTVVERNVIRYEDGSLVRRNDRTVRVATDSDVYRYHSDVFTPEYGGVTTDGARWTVAAYANGSLVAQMVSPPNKSGVYNVSTDGDGNPFLPVRYPHGTPLNQERAFVLLSRANVSVSGPQAGPYNLTATGFAGDRLTVDGTPITNVSLESFTATVRRNGVISEYRIVVTGTLDGKQVTATEHVAYSAIGNTDPRKPSWFDRAV